MYSKLFVSVAALAAVTGLGASAASAQSVVYAWGINDSAQIGDGTRDTRTSPVPVRAVGGAAGSSLTGVTAIAAGSQHSLGIGPGGTVYAWGGGALVGDGGFVERPSPVQVRGVGGAVNSTLTGITSVAAGNWHSVALGSGGEVYAWGSSASVQLGIGTTSGSHWPVRVRALGGAAGSSLTGITVIAAGSQHSLAIGPGGAVYAWGQNILGQLGDGTSATRNSPVQVRAVGGPEGSSLTGITAVAAGWSHSLAIGPGGTVYAWGSGGNGRLGDGTTTNRTSPVQVLGVGGAAGSSLTGITAVAAGRLQSLAVGAAGEVYAWGSGVGQLGNSSGSESSSPILVSALNGINIVDVEAAGFSSYALSAEGRLWAWGGGLLGLGDPATARAVPTEVFAPAGYRWNSIAGGAESSHVLATLSVIPSPGAVALLGLGGLVTARRRRA